MFNNSSENVPMSPEAEVQVNRDSYHLKWCVEAKGWYNESQYYVMSVIGGFGFAWVLTERY